MSKPKILWENPDVVLVDKPAGWLSIPDRYNQAKPNIQSWLQNQLGEIWTVHRLDRMTSGVICFAKHAEAHKQMQDLFESRKIEKKYSCLVHGITPESGRIDMAIGKHPSKKRMIISNKGKPSLTLYKRLATYDRFSLLEVEILTGRTHQIRVHMEAIQHPLMVDPLYSGLEAFYLSSVKRKFRLAKDAEERPLLNRVSLHASTLAFTLRNEKIFAAADLPKDLRATIRQLEKLS